MPEDDSRQVAEALHESQARLAGIVNSAMDAIITVNSDQRILLFNAAAERMFRCSAAAVLGQPLDRFIPDRFRAAHSSHISSFGQTGITTRAMARARTVYGLRTDGEEFPVEASISQVEAGGQKLYTVILRDISERVRAEERFRQVIEGAPNGMVMVEGSGKIVLVNAQIEKSFGYRRDELLGQSIEMLVPERFRAHHPVDRQGFTTDPSTRVMGAGRDLFGLRKDGTEFPVEIGLNPIMTEQGMMVLGTIVDITERKRAEETLRRSQAQLAGIIGSAMDAIISVDEEQRIILFNAAAERMFLYPVEEAIGQPLDRFIPKRFRPTHRQHIEEFGRTHVTRRSMGALGAIFGLRADGTEFPIEASISQLESAGRKFYIVILRDITERKLKEEAIKEHARMVDLAPVLIRDLHGRIIFWTTGAQQMYGWRSEEVVGKITHDLLQTEFPRPLAEIQARLYAHEHWEGELIHTRRDGQRIVIASHWVLHRDEEDRPKAILEINNDITERKQAEEALKESQHYFREMTESLPLLVWTCQGDGACDYLSPQWVQYTGIPEASQLGYGWLEQLHPDDREPVVAAWNRAIEEDHVFDLEFRIRRADGVYRWFKTRAKALKDTGGKIIKWYGTNTDIEDAKLVESALRQSEARYRQLSTTLEQRVADRTAQLETANKELETFSYSVSHDLRAPLRHINGFSQALLEDYAEQLDEDGRDYLQEVRNASQEMSQLIDDMLQLARVTRSEMRGEAVNLSEMTRGLLNELQRRDGGRVVAVHIEERLAAYGDRRLLRIMLTNLLENAWKFTSGRQRAEICFGQEHMNGETVYFVRDNGAGFDMAYADKLFGAFQRLHSASEFAGTGIGLATVQRIVHRHRGRIWAEGAIDQGATFYFTLSDSQEAKHGE